ncbi:MAG: heavy-metal-associated domain-containing protein [Ignavibacteriaceae bacterium]|nr:heavy-metal-associated domain-containing protein [Ignavibacteriaceae bacterium]
MERTFKIEGMSCSHCVMAVKKELNKVSVSDYKVEIGTVVVDTDKNNLSYEVIVKAIETAGYKVISFN